MVKNILLAAVIVLLLLNAQTLIVGIYEVIAIPMDGSGTLVIPAPTFDWL